MMSAFKAKSNSFGNMSMYCVVRRAPVAETSEIVHGTGRGHVTTASSPRGRRGCRRFSIPMSELQYYVLVKVF